MPRLRTAPRISGPAVMYGALKHVGRETASDTASNPIPRTAATSGMTPVWAPVRSSWSYPWRPMQ